MEQTGRGEEDKKQERHVASVSEGNRSRSGLLHRILLPSCSKHDTVCRKQQDRKQGNYARQLQGSDKQGRGIPDTVNQQQKKYT